MAEFRPDSTDLSNIGDLLRRKRKARPHRACQPCHLRKVKCTYQTPCQSCSDRGHPELCSYPLANNVSPKRLDVGPARRTPASLAPSAESWTPSRAAWAGLLDRVAALEQLLHRVQPDLGDGLGNPSARSSPPCRDSPPVSAQVQAENESGSIVQGVRALNDVTDEAVYIGGNSVPAMVMALGNGSADEVQQVLGRSILPVFGLDNDTATYPFVDLWGVPHGSPLRIELLCKLLPSDADCNQIFALYRDTAHVIYPAIAQLEQFESDLTAFLMIRQNAPFTAQPGGLTSQLVCGKDLHWIGLLFAVLASGMQCSDIPRKERQARSQVYVCCAYECLRIVNYLSRANLVDIQTLLVLGNVISNNMNAGVVWNMLGMTIRLAQSLGLHYGPPSADPSLEQTIRSDIWWQITWQDSLLSITFDRISSASTIVDHLPQVKIVSEASYKISMRLLCRISLAIVRQRATSQSLGRHLLTIQEFQQKIQEMATHVAGHLSDLAKCRTLKDQLEYWNFYLHRSYVLAELCRPAITFNRQKQDHKHRDLPRNLAFLCMESLKNTVEAYLGLQNITRFATQSWAAVHRSLSCAVLLGILGEPARNEVVRLLLLRIIGTMQAAYFGLDPMEIPTPVSRGVAALQKLTPLDSLAMDVPSVEVSDLGDMDTLLETDGFGSSSEDSPHAYFGEEQYPYTVLNSILWGDSAPLPI